MKSDFQDFMKRLRKKYACNCKVGRRKTCDKHAIRFFHCGEYGGKLGRPHYHAILFNHDFSDKKPFSKRGDNVVYTSKELEGLWGKGHALIGSVTYESAAYVARYVLKKVSGSSEMVSGHYQGRLPEYVTMSRRPGIGAKWFQKYGREVYSRGGGSVIVKGKEWKPPRYYDGLFAFDNPRKFEDVKFHREQNATRMSLSRLAVAEECAKARISMLKRPLEG